MINSISRKLAIGLSEYSGKTDEVDYIRYGIEILLGGLFKGVIIFVSAYLLGLLPATFAVFATFVVFRVVSGGHHYSTYQRCLLAGLVLMLSIASIATISINGDSYTFTLSLLVVFSVFFGFILTYKYVPSNHFYKKSTDKQKRTLRTLSFGFIVIWGLLMIYFLLVNNSHELIFASILGFLFQMSSTHPYTYSIVSRVERFLDRRFSV